MAGKGKIKVGVDFSVDVKEIQKGLQEIRQLTTKDVMNLNDAMGAHEAYENLLRIQSTAREISSALNKSFNSDLGTVNVTKFNEALQASDLDLDQIYNDLSMVGTVGQNTFTRLSSSLLATNQEIKQAHTLLDKMAYTMGNTVRWTVASSAMNSLTGSVESAYSYVKKLDSSLNDIRIVTNKSAEDMASFAESANKAAKSLGASTTDYTNASLIYYQQGLSDEEVATRTDVTLKAANVTGQSTSDVSEQLTAVWNGYNVATENAEESIDILAAVAASTASDLEELSTGMSKVASAASAMGVGEEQLAAQLSTIISVTRQAPESVGTALKTIYARMSDIEAGVDEEGATLGSYTGEMAAMGINVLDTTGSLRDMGEVIEEIGEKWSDYSREQQVALAQTMAGTRQYNNLIALFDNWDDYVAALDVANNATGTLQEQQEIYLESTEAHLQQLSTASEDLFDSLFSGEDINNIVDVITNAVEGISDFVDGIGGGKTALLALGSTATSVFSKQIASSLQITINNFKKTRAETVGLQADIDVMSKYGSLDLGEDEIVQLKQMKEEELAIDKFLTQEQKEQNNLLIEQAANVLIEKQNWDATAKVADEYLKNLQARGTLQVSSIDGSNEKSGIQSLNADQLNKVSGEVQDFIKELEESLNLATDLKSQAKEVQAEINSLDLNNATYKDFGKEKFQKVSQEIEQFSRSLTGADEDMESFTEKSQELLKALEPQSEEYNRLATAISNYQEAMLAPVTPVPDTTKLEAAQQLINTYRKTNLKVQDEIKNTADIINQQMSGATDNLNGRLNRITETQQKLIDQARELSTIDAFVQLAGGIGQVATAIESLTNLDDIWNNEDLTAVEKTTQVVSSLTMGITSLGFAYKSLQPTVELLSTKFRLQMASIAGLTDAQIVDMTTTELMKVASEKLTLQYIKENAQIAKQNALLAIRKALSNPLVLAAGAAVTAIAAIGVAVYQTTKQSEKLDDQLESLEDQIDSLTSVVADAEDAVEDFKDAMSDYSNALDEIEGLTKGTEEYTEAIEEANKKARELIETYNLLGNYTWKDGVIQIDEDAYQAQLDQLEETAARQRNLLAQSQVAKATVEYRQNYQNSELFNIEDWLSRWYDVNTEGTLVEQREAETAQTQVSGWQAQSTVEEIVKWAFQTTSEGRTYWEALQEQQSLLEQQKDYNSKEDEYEQLYDYYNQMITDYTQLQQQGLLDETRAEALEDAKRAIEELESPSEDNLLNESIIAVTDELGELPGAVADNTDKLLQNVDSLEELYQALETYRETVDYYTDQIISSEIEKKYGDRLEEIATDEEGNTDSALVSQMNAALVGVLNGQDSELKKSLSKITLSAESVKDLKDITNDAGEQFYEELNGRSDAKDLTGIYTDYIDQDAKVTYNKSNKEYTISKEGVEDQTLGLQEMITLLENNAEQQQIIDDFMEANPDWGEAQTDAIERLVEGAESTELSSAMLDALANGLSDALSDGFDKGDGASLDLTDYASSLSLDEFEAFKEGGINNMLEALGLSDASVDEIQTFFEDLGFESELAFYAAYCEASDISYEEYFQGFKERAVQEADEIGTLLRSYQDEDEWGDEELESLQALEVEYEELGKIQDRTSHEYLDTLRDIQEERESDATQAAESYRDLMADAAIEAKENFEAAYADGIDVEANLEKFEEAMANLQAAEYEVKVTVDADLSSDVDQAFGLADEIVELQDMVADDLTVTYEEAQALIDSGNAAILENCKETAESAIQLDKSVQDAYIDGKQAELQADAEARIQEFENQKVSLEAERSALQAKLEAIEKMQASAGDLDYEETLIEIANADAEYQAAVDELEGELTAEADAADDSQTINEELYNILGGMYETDAENQEQALTDAATAEAKTIEQRIANVKALFNAWTNVAEAVRNSADGTDTTWIDPGEVSGVDVTGQTTGSKDVETGEITFDGLNEENITKYAEMLEALSNKETGNREEYDATLQAAHDAVQEQLDAVEAQIGAVDAGIAALKSANLSLDKAQADASLDSGSSNDSEADKVDLLEDEADRYHDINLELKAISTSLERLQKQESKLLGQDLLDNLNEQLSLLESQIDATTRKMEIANEEALEYQTKLAAQGVTFDANGYISNYMDIMASKLAYVNAAIEMYNAMTKEEQDAYEDTLDQIKQDYEDFVDMISDYDTLISETIPELEDDIQDAIDEEIEIQITKFTMEVEIRLDMEEAEKDWNEFYRKVILGLDDDDILGNAVQDLADVLSYFNTTASDITDVSTSNLSDWINQISNAISSGGTGSIQALTDQVNDTLAQLAQIDSSGWSDVYGDNQSQALEDLQTYYTELMQQLEDVEDLVDEIEESYLDMIDEAVEAFDEQVEQYEYINDLLNHDVELISLLYGDDAYAEMANYYAQIEANNNQELDFLKQRVAYAYEMMQAETDDEARKAWQEEWEDALEELNDKVEDSIENIIDKYTNTINQIIDELNDSITDGLGLDYVSEEWDLINDAADIYLDKINAMYGIEEVQQKYLDAINDTDSISAQQKINDLMEEQLSYLEEKENLTEYDVERAEKLLEIELAQIALEEAQQNKSSMRLRRDSQGNYTYEYVADDDSVAEAQQELLELQNELYNFDKEEYQNNLNEMYSVYEEYQEKLLELYEDQTLSAEEREEKIALYAEYYGDIINSLVEENAVIRENLMDSAFTELAALYDVDVENFKNMSAEEQDELMNSLVPQWDSGVQHMADTFAADGGLIPTCEEALEELNNATNDYQSSLDELEAAAGIDLDAVASGYDYAAVAAEGLLAENGELIDQYDQEITAIQNVIDQLEDLISQYQAAQAAAEAATAAAYAYWQATQNANATAASSGSSSSASSYTSSSSATSSSSSSSASSSATTASTQGDGVLQVGDTATYTGGLYYYDSYGQNPSGSRGAGGTVTITSVKTDGRAYPIHVTSTNSAYGWLKQSQLTGYDTGGYTGDWDNSDGAIALLHQKELVLNSADTENILNAVSLVRDISSMLTNLDTSIFDKMFSCMSYLGSSDLGSYERVGDTLDQNVHIEANFPNVSSSSEIEAAFSNLVNSASQYANRATR